jgi:hypothetical protein
VAAPTAVPTARAAPVLGRSVATDRGWGAPELLALLLVGVAAAAQVVSRVTRS